MSGGIGARGRYLGRHNLTQEREVLARKMVAQGAAWREVWAALGALPGGPLPSEIATTKLLAARGITRANLGAPVEIRCTPERLRLARELVAAWMPWTQVMDRLHELPGPRFLNPGTAQSMLLAHGVKRPPVPPGGYVRPAVARPRAARPAPAPAPASVSAPAAAPQPAPVEMPAPEPNGRIYANRAQIAAWAAGHAWTFDGDMLPIQRLCRILNHPVIVCTEC